MAKKYIDQAVIIKMAKPYWQTDEDGFDVEWLFDKEPIIFKRDVEAIPAANVVEVRHGHWSMLSYDEAVCTRCGYNRDTPFDSTREARERWDELPPYCEMCGARMDGDGE